MGNELADAIRAELHRLAIAKYGTLDEAAKALGIPYKTLYRSLTTKGKDRTQRVSLDFVLEMAEALDVDLAYIYDRASSANVSGSDENVESRRQSEYARVAKKRSRNRGEEYYD